MVKSFLAIGAGSRPAFEGSIKVTFTVPDVAAPPQVEQVAFLGR
jgi:hypothetical protein